ncbi:hypothetical protein JWG40_08250 [Leptospira sp. 201903074]|uniref:hypothetical protein n=1 Tax=Leptospira abararensis TaxID=2810036 RepID=UPI001964FDF1|nr:hypothetical protein [Leptospira abararensis]MBM9547005.1 hypothetical protein [Leptospira abararensis]
MEISDHKNKSFLLEKSIVPFTDIVLSQDRGRGKILRAILKYKKVVSFIPNSTSGQVISIRKNFFHKALNIPANSKILLMTGTIESFMGSDSFLDLIPFLPENWVAVIHGWIPTSATREKVEETQKKYPDKLFLSHELVDNKDKFDIFSSVDLCFVNFRPDDLNLKYALYSAGKLYDSAKAGIPVLINELPGARTFVKEHKNGFLLKEPNELPILLKNIGDRSMIGLCHNFYIKNEFERSYDQFLSTYCEL